MTDIGNLRITIDVDAGDVAAELAKIEGALNSFASSMEAMEGKFTKMGTALAGSLKPFEAAVKATQSQFNQLAITSQKAGTNIEKNFGAAANTINSVGNVASNTAKQFTQTGSAATKMANQITSSTQKTQQAGNTVASTGRMYNNFASSMTHAGAALTGAGLLLGQAVAPIKDFAKDSFDYGMQFEYSMAKVGSVAGGTKEEIADMTKVARKMGDTTFFSSQQAAEGMYYLASAGLDSKEIMAALPGVINLATATQEDLAKTSEYSMSAISQFGLQAGDTSKVADIFTGAINRSQLEMESLGESLKYVGATAHANNMSLGETVGFLGTLADAGIKGSMAGARLRGFIRELYKLETPTAREKKVMQEFNLEFSKLDPNANKLVDIVDYLNKKNVDMAGLQALFGEPANVVRTLMQAGKERITGLTEEITTQEWASKTAAMQMDTAYGKYTQMMNSVKDIQIEIFDAFKPMFESFTKFFQDNKGSIKSFVNEMVQSVLPLAQKVLDFFTGMFEKFEGLDPKTQSLVAKVTGLAAAFAVVAAPLLTIAGGTGLLVGGLSDLAMVLGGPLGLVLRGGGLFTSLLGGAGSLTAATAGITAAGGASAGAAVGIAAIATSLATLAIPAAAIAIGFEGYTKNVNGFKDAVDAVGGHVSDMFSNISTAMSGQTGAWSAAGSSCGQAFADTVMGVISSLPGMIAGVLAGMGDTIGNSFANMGDAIGRFTYGFTKEIVKASKDAIGSLWDAGTGIGKGAANLITNPGGYLNDLSKGLQNILSVKQQDNTSGKTYSQTFADAIPDIFKIIPGVQVGLAVAATGEGVGRAAREDKEGTSYEEYNKENYMPEDLQKQYVDGLVAKAVAAGVQFTSHTQEKQYATYMGSSGQYSFARDDKYFDFQSGKWYDVTDEFVKGRNAAVSADKALAAAMSGQTAAIQQNTDSLGKNGKDVAEATKPLSKEAAWDNWRNMGGSYDKSTLDASGKYQMSSDFLKAWDSPQVKAAMADVFYTAGAPQVSSGDGKKDQSDKVLNADGEANESTDDNTESTDDNTDAEEKLKDAIEKNTAAARQSAKDQLSSAGVNGLLQILNSQGVSTGALRTDEKGMYDVKTDKEFPGVVYYKTKDQKTEDQYIPVQLNIDNLTPDQLKALGFSNIKTDADIQKEIGATESTEEEKNYFKKSLDQQQADAEKSATDQMALQRSVDGGAKDTVRAISSLEKNMSLREIADSLGVAAETLKSEGADKEGNVKVSSEDGRYMFYNQNTGIVDSSKYGNKGEVAYSTSAADWEKVIRENAGWNTLKEGDVEYFRTGLGNILKVEKDSLKYLQTTANGTSQWLDMKFSEATAAQFFSTSGITAIREGLQQIGADGKLTGSWSQMDLSPETLALDAKKGANFGPLIDVKSAKWLSSSTVLPLITQADLNEKSAQAAAAQAPYLDKATTDYYKSSGKTQKDTVTEIKDLNETLTKAGYITSDELVADYTKGTITAFQKVFDPISRTLLSTSTLGTYAINQQGIDTLGKTYTSATSQLGTILSTYSGISAAAKPYVDEAKYTTDSKKASTITVGNLHTSTFDKSLFDQESINIDNATGKMTLQCNTVTIQNGKYTDIGTSEINFALSDKGVDELLAQGSLDFMTADEKKALKAELMQKVDAFEDTNALGARIGQAPIKVWSDESEQPETPAVTTKTAEPAKTAAEWDGSNRNVIKDPNAPKIPAWLIEKGAAILNGTNANTAAVTTATAVTKTDTVTKREGFAAIKASTSGIKAQTTATKDNTTATKTTGKSFLDWMAANNKENADNLKAMQDLWKTGTAGTPTTPDGKGAVKGTGADQSLTLVQQMTTKWNDANKQVLDGWKDKLAKFGLSVDDYAKATSGLTKFLNPDTKGEESPDIKALVSDKTATSDLKTKFDKQTYTNTFTAATKSFKDIGTAGKTLKDAVKSYGSSLTVPKGIGAYSSAGALLDAKGIDSSAAKLKNLASSQDWLGSTADESSQTISKNSLLTKINSGARKTNTGETQKSTGTLGVHSAALSVFSSAGSSAAGSTSAAASGTSSLAATSNDLAGAASSAAGAVQTLIAALGGLGGGGGNAAAFASIVDNSATKAKQTSDDWITQKLGGGKTMKSGQSQTVQAGSVVIQTGNGMAPVTIAGSLDATCADGNCTFTKGVADLAGTSIGWANAANDRFWANMATSTYTPSTSLTNRKFGEVVGKGVAKSIEDVVAPYNGQIVTKGATTISLAGAATLTGKKFGTTTNVVNNMIGLGTGQTGTTANWWDLKNLYGFPSSRGSSGSSGGISFALGAPGGSLSGLAGGSRTGANMAWLSRLQSGQGTLSDYQWAVYHGLIEPDSIPIDLLSGMTGSTGQNLSTKLSGVSGLVSKFTGNVNAADTRVSTGMSTVNGSLASFNSLAVDGQTQTQALSDKLTGMWSTFNTGVQSTWSNISSMFSSFGSSSGGGGGGYGGGGGSSGSATYNFSHVTVALPSNYNGGGMRGSSWTNYFSGQTGY